MDESTEVINCQMWWGRNNKRRSLIYLFIFLWSNCLVCRTVNVREVWSPSLSGFYYCEIILYQQSQQWISFMASNTHTHTLRISGFWLTVNMLSVWNERERRGFRLGLKAPVRALRSRKEADSSQSSEVSWRAAAAASKAAETRQIFSRAPLVHAGRGFAGGWVGVRALLQSRVRFTWSEDVRSSTSHFLLCFLMETLSEC